MLLLCSRCNSIVVGETVEVEVGIEDAPAWPSNITVRVAWPFSNRELFNVSRINFAPTMTGCLSRFGARWIGLRASLFTGRCPPCCSERAAWKWARKRKNKLHTWLDSDEGRLRARSLHSYCCALEQILVLQWNRQRDYLLRVCWISEHSRPAEYEIVIEDLRLANSDKLSRQVVKR